MLSTRLRSITDLFGQLPDTLEDVWVKVAIESEAEAQKMIDAVPEVHPFPLRYDRIDRVDLELCSTVLESRSQLEALRKGW